MTFQSLKFYEFLKSDRLTNHCFVYFILELLRSLETRVDLPQADLLDTLLHLTAPVVKEVLFTNT